jgi:UDP-N-acetylglucosamine acyltransferase
VRLLSIHPTAVVAPEAKIAEGCSIGPYAQIGPHVTLGEDIEIGAFVVVDGWTQIGRGCEIFTHAVLGTPPQHLGYKGEETLLEIGQYTMVREFVTINRGTIEGGGRTSVGDHNFLMAYSHVGHDCRLGSHIIMANGASLAGHVEIEDYVNLGAMAGIHQFVRIGCYAMVGAYSGVGKDVPPYVMVSGIRPKPYGLNLVGLKRHNFSSGTLQALKEAFRLLYSSHLNTSQALEEITTKIESTTEIRHLVEFIQASKRGITK